MLLALVPSGRFIGNFTAVAASERSTGPLVCIVGSLGKRPSAAPAASLAAGVVIDRTI
jgi:hypothetical protein